MNEIRRAGLEQLAMTIEAAMGQLTALLDAERVDIKDLPDNIEDSDFADRVLKRPMFELAQARVMLLEVGRAYQCCHCERQRMNVKACNAQLLVGGDVAMATYAWASVRMDSPIARFRWSDTALRLLGAHRITQVSQHRISTAQGSALESRRFCDCLRGALRSGSLRGCFRSAMGHKRTGARGPLFSKTCGEQQ